MSYMFNYDAPGATKIYDRKRIAVGADVIAGLIQLYCGKPLKDIHVLDAGCGTGQYAKCFVEMGIGKLSLLDASPKMLNIANVKLNDAIKQNVVDTVVEAKLPDLPFEDGIFDAVMFNQVLQHIDKDCDGKNFLRLEKTRLSTKRILRRKGVLIITTGLPSTIRESMWFLQIHPVIADMINKRLMSVTQYLALFAKHGLHCVSAMNFLATPSSPMTSDYWNPDGPLSEEWRIATNLFEVSGRDKVKEMEDIANGMKKKGTLKEFMIDRDRTSERGQYICFVCIST